MNDKKRTAFVMMPFSEAFDEIYNSFIRSTLESAGLHVIRADDIQNAQSILKDIVQAINACDLIIADLSDSNPNVYYELGLAHAFGKPVILLTQEMGDLPFDLRSYRVIPYQTHFTEMDRAKHTLAEVCAGFLDGSVQFGNPVTDYSEQVDSAVRPRDNAQEPDEDEPGFLDNIIDMNEGFEELTSFVGEYGQKTAELGESTRKATEGLNRLDPSSSKETPKIARRLVTTLASKIDSYASFLKDLNANYRRVLEKTRSSLEATVSGHDPKTEEEIDQLQVFLDQMSGARSATVDGIKSIEGMTSSLEETPSMERSYNRARNSAVAQLKNFLDNLEQTEAMIQRAVDIGREKLNAAG